MSHTVVRGKPNGAQLYLDNILDAILIERGVLPDPVQRDNVTLSQIMFHCLKERPRDVFMTNGATGQDMTNEQLLKRAVSLARALTAKGARGKYAMLLTRNHQDMAVIYFAIMFAGIIPFMMDPNTTVYELTHFLNLIEPSYIFHDQEFNEYLQESLQGCNGLKPSTLVAEPEVLQKFSDGFSDDVHNYQSYHTQFPTPTKKVMLLTTIQWMTFTMLMTCSVAYHVPLLMSPKKATPEHVVEMMETYRPSWTFLGPAFATLLVALLSPEQMSSMETLILLGAPATPELMAALQEKLPKTAHLCDGYGTTETQGFIAIPDRDAPLKCNGWVYNFLYYKIVDDQNQELGLNQSGELWVKGVSVIKSYHKNDSSYSETFTKDGWYRTGDVFYVDGNERLSFVVRKKFSFKYKGCQVAPEEVERVICSVPGVHECVVCASDKGPAAAVVLVPHADVTKEQIHKAVNSTLSDHKRLHGGIAIVTSLPHTHSGKLKRNECSQLIAELIKNGQCL